MKNGLSGFLVCLYFFILSCQATVESDVITPAEQDSSKTELKDSVSLVVDPYEDSLKAYFDFPVDFFALKKKTTHMHSGGSKYLQKDRLHQSQQPGTIFYVYWAIEFVQTNSETDYSLQFVTWKPWTTAKEKYYETDNEELIGIESAISWNGLQQSNFVGKTLEEIELKFGYNHYSKNDCIVYLQADKILILSMKSEKVNWFKYYWLSEPRQSVDDLPDYFFKWNNR